MRIVGIDPGMSGGMACFMEDANGPDVFKFDGATDHDIAARLREWCDTPALKVLMERVGPSRGHDGRKQGVGSAFTFGERYGFLRGMLVAMDAPFELVLPRAWCKTFSLTRGEDESQSEWKNRHKARVQELFPTLKVTHAIADAILIAEHARRVGLVGVNP
jgi:hypothetical protein